MRLLMITRKVDKDDSFAGFVYDWVKHFGENVDKLNVICLQKGNLDGLPKNIVIYSLDENNGKQINRYLRLLRRLWRFHGLAKILIKDVDAIFSHMNPEYAILIAPYAKFYKKPLIHWYTHKKVSWRLRLVGLLVDKIVTASPESCCLKSKKVIPLSHGIDTSRYIFPVERTNDSLIRILTIGRISPSKNIEFLIEAVEKNIKDKKLPIVFEIIGKAGLTSQQAYFDQLKEIVEKRQLNNQIEFLGDISTIKTVEYYQKADIFLNASLTGSVDKVVLEAMACGCLPLTSNEAFRDILPEQFRFKQNDAKDLSDKIVQLINMSDQEKNEWRLKLRKIVEDNHNLDNLIKKILVLFNI